MVSSCRRPSAVARGAPNTKHKKHGRQAPEAQTALAIQISPALPPEPGASLPNRAAPPPQVSVHEELRAELRAAHERADKAETALEEQHSAQIKLKAKLAAVTTLYTESMQREVSLKSSRSSLEVV